MAVIRRLASAPLLFHISTDKLLASAERGSTFQIKIQSLVQSQQRIKKLLLCNMQDQLVMDPTN